MSGNNSTHYTGFNYSCLLSGIRNESSNL